MFSIDSSTNSKGQQGFLNKYIDNTCTYMLNHAWMSYVQNIDTIFTLVFDEELSGSLSVFGRCFETAHT